MEAPGRGPIYLVEDDESVRVSAGALLQAAGYAVRAYGTAEELLAAGMGDTGCLMLDYNLPGMTGVELLAALRARDITIPAIIVSAANDIPPVAGLGVDTVFQKPMAVEDLLECLDRLLSKTGA